MQTHVDFVIRVKTGTKAFLEKFRIQISLKVAQSTPHKLHSNYIRGSEQGPIAAHFDGIVGVNMAINALTLTFF